MTDKRVWFITGAGRGMGADIAKAVLAAGHRLVASAFEFVTAYAASKFGLEGRLESLRVETTPFTTR